MATLKDISAELGLLVATVSRALNGFPEVSARTRARVQDVADRIGYKPNRIAQRLVTGRSGMVGFIAIPLAGLRRYCQSRHRGATSVPQSGDFVTTA